jgi:DNA-binding NarL/FixJ family response regulator
LPRAEQIERRPTSPVIAGPPIRVVAGDDSYLVREGIRHVLGNQDEVELVGLCQDYDELLETVRVETPAVVLADIRMPPTHSDEGVRLAAELRRAQPEIGVILLSQFADARYAIRLFELGSEGRGYLLKERLADSAELLGAIWEIAGGGSVVDAKVVDVLVAARAASEQSAVARLTPREREVLAALAQGKSNQAIANSLFLSKRGVETHISSIFGKLGLPQDEANVSRRVTAALMFLADETV